MTPKTNHIELGLQVYGSTNTCIAHLAFAEDAAHLVALYGDGATIRQDHGRVLWHEGKESLPAGESYDFVVTVVNKRMGMAA